jgi:hypothetical protein
MHEYKNKQTWIWIIINIGSAEYYVDRYNMYQSNSIKGIKSWGGMEGIDDRWRGRDLCNLYRVCWRRVNTAHLSLCVCVCVCVCVWIFQRCVCASIVCEWVCVYICEYVLFIIYVWSYNRAWKTLFYSPIVSPFRRFAFVCVCVCVCCVCGVCVCVCVWRREYLPPPQFCLFLALPQKRKKHILK